MPEQFDIVVVGAGISGATLAHLYAKSGRRVLVIEKRNHIAGNCYDFMNEHGVLVPKYGPHFFHTNYEDVWEFVSRFTDWHPYEHRVRAMVEGKLVPVPVNIETINTLFGLNMQTEEEARSWLEQTAEKIENPKDSEEAALARVGRVLYEKIFKNYTKKQWDLWPHELDPSVTSRIPVRTNFDDRYFTDKHQAMPKDGYTEAFKKMLGDENITVRVNTDYFTAKETIAKPEKLFFTGKIDHYFEDKGFEPLLYRSLWFEHETLPQEFYQSGAQINYPNDFAFTRITEPKHATGQKHDKTTIIREFSSAEGEPYYPVPNPRNHEIYAKYQQEAEKLEKDGIYFVGRLANYKYFNMDQAFKNALDLYRKIEQREP